MFGIFYAGPEKVFRHCHEGVRAGRTCLCLSRTISISSGYDVLSFSPPPTVASNRVDRMPIE